MGSGPTQEIITRPPLLPPNWGGAQSLGGQLAGMWGQSLPQYGGQVDPGMSPSMNNAMHMLQARSVSKAPWIAGEAASSMGGLMQPGMGAQGLPQAYQGLQNFMQPSFQNPYARLQQQAPNYFQNAGAGPPMG